MAVLFFFLQSWLHIHSFHLIFTGFAPNWSWYHDDSEDEEVNEGEDELLRDCEEEDKELAFLSMKEKISFQTAIHLSI